jgi:hypothetical protein
MAQILVIACGKKPYNSMMRKRDNQDNNNDGDDNDDTDNDDEDDGDKNMFCLVQWSREQWERLQDELQQLRQVLLRDDATINYSSMSDTTCLGFPSVSAAASAAASKPTNPGVDDSSDDDDNDNDDDDDHCKLVALSPSLGRKFKKLLLYIEINKAIAPIREQLERQIREEPIKVSNDSNKDDENNNNNNDVVVVETKELIEIL